MPFRRYRHGWSASVVPEQENPLAFMWVWRILMPLGGYKRFVGMHHFEHEDLARDLGLGHWLDPDVEFDSKAAMRELSGLYKRWATPAKAPRPNGCLERNMERLAKRVGLSKVDTRILEFAVLLHGNPMLDAAADLLGELSSAKVYRVLAKLLSLPEAAVKTALSGKGTLQQSGLLALDRRGQDSLGGKLDLLSDEFPDHMISSESDPIDLLSGSITPGAAPHLTLRDYPHARKALDLLKPYLRQALKARHKGVNIFLYGVPGTGKTQLVRALARHLRCDLFEVASEDAEGDAITGMKRLRAYRAGQYFFAKRRNLILFDEVEDVFFSWELVGGRFSSAQQHKAWLNRILEESPVPTLWVSNESDGINSAFLRRFKMVFELPVPPESKRRQIIGAACRDLLAPAHIGRLAESPVLAPAVVTQTAGVVRSVREAMGEEAASAAFDMVINNTLRVQGHRPVKRLDPGRLPETYDPAAINADADPQRIAAGLARAKAGRLCLHGPPGTGKTAYCRWLAKRLDVPLLAKRGSDLISMWVGETEKNIARAFEEAERDGALLLIDEVDGFLQDRRRAKNSWEVTGVNEMLTQMEAFPGVFIASTNLMDGLDQAALRRFDLKMKFGYLAPEQGWRLFASHCKRLRLPLANPAALQGALGRLRNLTPGDFAAVLRRHRFQPLASALDLQRALAQECALKEGGANPIGFV